MPEGGVAVVSIRGSCPYYDEDVRAYDYDDEALVDLCGIKNIEDGGEEACPPVGLHDCSGFAGTVL